MKEREKNQSMALYYYHHYALTNRYVLVTVYSLQTKLYEVRWGSRKTLFLAFSVDDMRIPSINIIILFLISQMLASYPG